MTPTYLSIDQSIDLDLPIGPTFIYSPAARRCYARAEQHSWVDLQRRATLMTNCPTHASPYRSPPLPPPPPTVIPPHLSLCARYNYNYPLLRQWSNTTTASSTSSTPLRFSTRPPDYPGDQGFPSVGVRAICPNALVVPLLLIPLFSSTLSIVHGGAPRWGL